MKWIKTFWYLLALAVVIFLAYMTPERSLHFQRLTGIARTACIAGIFLVSGLTLPTHVLRASIANWRLHVFIQGFNLALIPLFFALLRPLLLRGGMDRILADGFIILACMPTTIATSVAMTGVADGNKAGAICNSTLGNLLGVVISPLLLYLLLSLRGSLDWAPVIRELALLIVLPVFVGQLVRMPFKRIIALWQKRLSFLSQILLLIVIYFIFINTFSLDITLSSGALPGVAVVALIAHLLFLSLNWHFSKAKFWRMNLPDRIAALMCGPQKTVALGIPLIMVIYDNSPMTGILSVPLLCYHSLQILIGSFLAVIIGKRTSRP